MEKKYMFSEMSSDDISTFLDRATPREKALMSIYSELPELFKEKGEILLSNRLCVNCNEATIYVGPKICIFNSGQCLSCGHSHIKLNNEQKIY